jgi:hypothetical protein
MALTRKISHGLDDPKFRAGILGAATDDLRRRLVGAFAEGTPPQQRSTGATMKPRVSGYASLIKKLCPKHDPRHVEAYMRLDHPTLDGLSPEQFKHEAEVSAGCVDQGGVDQAEKLAQSYGL